MPYRYECHACQTVSPQHTWRSQADRVRDEHRAEAHHGMAPAAGDRVRHVVPSVRGPAIVAAVLLLCALIKGVTGVAPDDVARWVGLL